MISTPTGHAPRLPAPAHGGRGRRGGTRAHPVRVAAHLPKVPAHLLKLPGHLAKVDATTTLPPGSPATVSVTVEGNTLRFSFGIPQGQPGDPGPPGEVTEAQLAAGLETRAHQVSSVDSLNLTPEAEYSPAQLEEVVTKFNEALNALKGG